MLSPTGQGFDGPASACLPARLLQPCPQRLPALREKYGLRFYPADTVGRGRRGKAGKYGRPTIDHRHPADAEIAAFGMRSKQAGRTSKPKSCSNPCCALDSGRAKSDARAISELSLRGADTQMDFAGQSHQDGDAHSVPLVRGAVILIRRVPESATDRLPVPFERHSRRHLGQIHDPPGCRAYVRTSRTGYRALLAKRPSNYRQDRHGTPRDSDRGP